MLLRLEPTGGRRTAARAQPIDQTLTPLKFFVIQLAQDLVMRRIGTFLHDRKPARCQMRDLPLKPNIFDSAKLESRLRFFAPSARDPRQINSGRLCYKCGISAMLSTDRLCHRPTS